MNNYLIKCREIISENTNHDSPILFVLGNESCDLDSAVSALSLAYYYDQNQTIMGYKLVIPILNIPRKNLPLKTEVVYYLKQNDIVLENLICADEVYFSDFKLFKLALVDFHMTTLSDHVISIIDHRPLDPQFQMPKGSSIIIEEVGSCATLIFREIMKTNNSFEDFHLVLRLLYGAIVLDTVNFSPAADKARTADVEAVNAIESLLKINNIEEHRTTLFNSLVKARSDVSNLDSFQILSKDLKVLEKSSDNVIAIPGFPILVSEYIKLAQASENIVKFMNLHHCCLIVLMGMKVSENKVERDIGIISNGDQTYLNMICKTLEDSRSPNLELTENENNFMQGKFYVQHNVKMSRKQILPIIKETM